MSYRVNRGALGFQRWGVTNPWVFADLSQPQRQRGHVSPVVFQSQAPYLRTRLGDADVVPATDELLRRAEQRGQRMESIAIAGLVISTTYLLVMVPRIMRANRRRRGR